MHTQAEKREHKNSNAFDPNESKKLYVYDPQISTLSTFKTQDLNKNKKPPAKRAVQNRTWNFSATTLTRDESPSHKIPLSKRFRSTVNAANKIQNFVSLDLREELTKGITFCKSKRKDYFIHPQNYQFPSSASYHENPENQQTNGRKTLKLINFSPDAEKRIHYINHSMNNTRIKRKSLGLTISTNEKIHFRAVDHARKMPHHPILTAENPGIGKYDVEDMSKPKTPSYTMRIIGQRFNENNEIIPGPGAYRVEEGRPNSVASINQKGTFQQSKRTYLTNPDTKTPGPGAYENL